MRSTLRSTLSHSHSHYHPKTSKIIIQITLPNHIQITENSLTNFQVSKKTITTFSLPHFHPWPNSHFPNLITLFFKSAHEVESNLGEEKCNHAPLCVAKKMNLKHQHVRCWLRFVSFRSLLQLNYLTYLLSTIFFMFQNLYEKM